MSKDTYKVLKEFTFKDVDYKEGDYLDLTDKQSEKFLESESITIAEIPPYGEKTCAICGCKMSGPGVTEETECAELDKHPIVAGGTSPEVTTDLFFKGEKIKSPIEDIILGGRPYKRFVLESGVGHTVTQEEFNENVTAATA